MKRFRFLALLLLCVQSLCAKYYFTVETKEGITIKCTEDKGVIYIGSYYDSSSSGPAFDSSVTGTVTIPDSVFYNGIKRKVYGIVRGAFKGCSSVSEIILPDGIQINSLYTFEGCSSLLYIPSNITHIGSGMFKDCTSLTSVVIPGETISMNAFEGCNSLSEVSFEGKYIESNAFKGCCNLSQIHMQNIESIGSSAFKDCSSLTSVYLPNIERLGDNVFSGCIKLTEVTTSDKLSSYGKNIFSGCINLTYVVWYGDVIDDMFNGFTNLKKVILNKEVTQIGKSAFYGCTSLDSIVIPSTVCNINEGAFYNCSSLKSIVIPKAVNYIGKQAFAGCSVLTGIDIPNNVTGVGAEAFQNCSDLEYAHIGNGVSEIGENCFKGCLKLQEVIFDNCSVTIGNYAFNGSPIIHLNFGSNVEKIGDYAFSRINIKKLVLPDSIWSIGKNAFSNNDSLNCIVIPKMVTEKRRPYLNIGDNAFQNCEQLDSIIFLPKQPSGIYFGENVFGNVDDYKLYIPYRTKDVYKELSSNVLHRPTVEIPLIGDFFYDDIKTIDGLQKIVYKITSIAPFEAQIGDGSSNAIFEVGDGCISLPTLAVGDDGTTFKIVGIAENAFENTSFSSIKIPITIIDIAKNAFVNCPNLDSVYVSWRNPNSITINNNNFQYLGDNTALFVPAGTKEIYAEHEVWGRFFQILESSPISTGDILARYGSKVDLPISLRNEDEIVGLQFRLTLPEGVSVAENGDGLTVSLTDRTRGMTVMGRKDPDASNSYLFVLFSLEGSSISDHEGAVMNVKLNIASDLALGDYEIKIEDVYMTTPSFETLNPPEAFSDLTITDVLLGDVNGDGIINVTDAIGVVNFILRNTPTVFVEAAADVNSDGIINVTDAIGIINMILNKDAAARAATNIMTDPQ